MGNEILVEEVDTAELLGFRYKPGEAPVYAPIQKADAGLHVGIYPQELSSPESVFQNLTEDDWDMKAINPIPNKADSKWKSLVEWKSPGIASQESLKLSQGFLHYTYNCLEYLYKTGTGQTLLDALRQSNHRVTISPSNMGNQIRNASNPNAFPPLVKRLLNSGSRFTAADGLVRLVQAAFQAASAQASMNLMATAMNAMPLYSLFKAAPYEFANQGFLGTWFPITGAQLTSWFTQGQNSQFAATLATTNSTVREVSVAKYTRLAAIIALRNQWLPGAGSNVGVNFNTKYNKDYLPQSRPPAIGLGHELIHAYWAIKGEQLGGDLGDYSTLLFEMKCVGLGPWAGAAISENSIRTDWNGINRNGMDSYNDKAVQPRMLYEKPDADNTASREKARKDFSTI